MTGPEQRLDLEADVEEHLYRLVSEALHNVVKHADARSASVSLSIGHASLSVVVTDDGQRFDQLVKRPGHLGMSTMAERAQAIGSELTVTSAPGTGARVAFSLPYALPHELT